MNCFECGTPRKPGGKFCGYCGVSYAAVQRVDTGVDSGVSSDVDSGVSSGVGSSVGSGVDSGVGSGVGPGVDSGVGSGVDSGVGSDVGYVANDNSKADHVPPGFPSTSDRVYPQHKSSKDSNTLIIVSATIIIVIGIALIVFLVLRNSGSSGSETFDMTGMWMTPGGTILTFNPDGTVGPMLFGFDGGPSGSWTISSRPDENGHYTLQASHITGGAPVFKVHLISNDEIELHAESGVYFGRNFYHLIRQ